MVRLVATSTSLDAQGFAKLFFEHIFPHYGCPLQIVSDRDTRRRSEFFQAICKVAGIQLSMSTAYHPQTNGLTEKSNDSVETVLRHFVGADMTDWDEFLPFVEFALIDSYR